MEYSEKEDFTLLFRICEHWCRRSFVISILITIDFRLYLPLTEFQTLSGVNSHP
jgi:hypothetical protein